MDLQEKIKKAPTTPGIYYLKNNKGVIIYIGMAKNLRNRLRTHYQLTTKATIAEKNLYTDFADFEVRELGSELEAMIAESNAIKTRQPVYNKMLRDDRSYSYVGVSKEKLPRLVVARESAQQQGFRYYGPYTNGQALRKVLYLVRRVYPYKTCKNPLEKPCFYYHLGLCPAHFPKQSSGVQPLNLNQGEERVEAITRENTKKVLRLLTRGPTTLIRELKRSLREYAQAQRYEEAGVIRDRLFALENIVRHKNIIKDGYDRISATVSLDLLKDALDLAKTPQRIEVYDMSNLGQDHKIGAMTVFINGIIAPHEFRYFKIKGSQSIGDPQMMQETIMRRLRHVSEWPLPDLILLDGGKSQLSAVKEGIARYNRKHSTNFAPPLITLAKLSDTVYTYKNHRIAPANGVMRVKNLRNFLYRMILSAHRFGKKRLSAQLLKQIHDSVTR